MSSKGSHTSETQDASTGGNRRVIMPDLPRPATSLVGRKREVQEVIGLLRDQRVRLVTLTGAGGIGKTRLALAIAEEAGSSAFVPLAAVTRPELIATTILQALGVLPSRAYPDAQVLHEALRGHKILLVLDNLEHLLSEVTVISDLLGACPELTILATSRVRLGLSGEHVVAVEPLESPDPSHLPSLNEVADASGVRLFVERARAIQPDFALTAANATMIATICQQVDGLPLAIELAAARTNILTTRSLSERLERRLELLTGGPRDAPARHQTMRATISWSYDLLSSPEQRLFRRLAVFEGSVALSEIEAIALWPTDGAQPEQDGVHAVEMLSTLVDHNLVVPTHGLTSDGETRIEMVSTVCEFALEQLEEAGEKAAMRDAHAAIYLALATEGETHLVREVDLEWLDRLELDHPNFRGALTWTLRDDAGPAALQIGAQIAGSLWLFWYYHSHLAEGKRWLDRALAAASEIPAPVTARVLLGLGTLLHFLGEPARAFEMLQQGLRQMRDLGDISGTAYVLTGLGNVAEDIGRYEDAEWAFSKANELFAQLDDQVNVAVTLYHLGVVAVGQGNLPLAMQRLGEALALSRRQRDPWSTAASVSYLGLVRVALGDVPDAADALAEGLALYRQLGTIERIVEVLRRVAVLAGARLHAATAIRLFAAANTLGARIGMTQALPERAMYERALVVAEGRLSKSRRDSEAASGAALSLDAAIAEAEHELVESRQRPRSRPGASGLSKRELEVLRLMADGASDQEIANELVISPRTASQHVTTILAKLKAGNRTAAVAIALRRGLI